MDLATLWRHTDNAGGVRAGKFLDGFVSATGSIPRTVNRWIRCCRLHAHPVRQVGRYDTQPALSLGIATPVAILLTIITGKLRIPRWSFAVLSLLVMLIAAFCFNPTTSWPAFVVLVCTLVLTPALIAGSVIGWVAAHRGSRLQGDIAMAIFVAFLAVQGIGRVRTAPQASTPHTAITLETNLLDACVGDYEMVPDNVYGTGAKVTVRRNGDHLVWQSFRGPMGLDPESETVFFFKDYDAQVTFTKDDKGEVMAISRHKPGVPDSEGKKLKKRMIVPLARSIE